jgi:hypothetical protein
MTKKQFSKQVFELVRNGIDFDKSDDEITDDLEIFMDCLEPRDREQFAKWGYEKDQSTPEKCWG